jgi:hypothetical protein
MTIQYINKTAAMLLDTFISLKTQVMAARKNTTSIYSHPAPTLVFNG